jgi:O-antigen/teichoic acid export membrane protein
MHESNVVFLIPILISLGAFAMIFGLVYLGNREKMAMIEKGMNPREKVRRSAPGYLKWGMLLIGAGVGLLLAFLIDTLMIPHEVEPAAVYFSLIAIGGGIGLVASYRMDKKELVEREANQ